VICVASRAKNSGKEAIARPRSCPRSRTAEPSRSRWTPPSPWTRSRIDRSCRPLLARLAPRKTTWLRALRHRRPPPRPPKPPPTHPTRAKYLPRPRQLRRPRAPRPKNLRPMPMWRSLSRTSARRSSSVYRQRWARSLLQRACSSLPRRQANSLPPLQPTTPPPQEALPRRRLPPRTHRLTLPPRPLMPPRMPPQQRPPSQRRPLLLRSSRSSQSRLRHRRLLQRSSQRCKCLYVEIFLFIAPVCFAHHYGYRTPSSHRPFNTSSAPQRPTLLLLLLLAHQHLPPPPPPPLPLLLPLPP